jgi:hypothetical protein
LTVFAQPRGLRATRDADRLPELPALTRSRARLARAIDFRALLRTGRRPSVEYKQRDSWSDFPDRGLVVNTTALDRGQSAKQTARSTTVLPANCEPA